MKSEQSLPLTEQVEEVRARSEDRLEQIVVPALENFLGALSQGVEAVRERLSGLRRT